MRRGRLFGPMVEIGRLQAELNRLFAALLENHDASLAPSARWDPNTDVVEDGSELRVLLEVPGLSPGDLKIGVSSSTLIVTGTKPRPASPGAPARFLCLERDFGEFEKRIPLPFPVNVHGATASLSGGVLRIVFPRVEDRRESYHPIPIQGPKGKH